MVVVSGSDANLRDLEEVQAWYAEQGVPDVGRGWWRKCSSASRRWPIIRTGRVVAELDQPFLRELIHPPFRIVYRRDPKRVRVVHV